MEVSPLTSFCTANLFLLISSILGSRTAGPHTQFVQWFMEECVDCLEQGSRGSILQFMPFTTVSTLNTQRAAAGLSRGGVQGHPSQGERGLPPGTSHSHELPCVHLSVAGIRIGKDVCHVQPQGGSGHHRPQPSSGPPGGCQSHCCTLRALEWQRVAGEGHSPSTSKRNGEVRRAIVVQKHVM